VPATVAIMDGKFRVGVEGEDLERLAVEGHKAAKASRRDVAALLGSGELAGTTVATTMMAAHWAGIRVFATGGIGGVHRDAPYDESADLAELARTAMIVVCAGAKSILDLPATWERLESLGIPVVGYQTNELPGFFTASTGIRLDGRVDDVAEVVEVFRAHRALGRTQSLLVVQPPPSAHALERDQVDAVVAGAQAEARAAGIAGAAVTPYLLAAVMRLTEGRSLDANLALLEQNAALAGAIATMCSRTATP